jgi:hypothetical protein
LPSRAISRVGLQRRRLVAVATQRSGSLEHNLEAPALRSRDDIVALQELEAPCISHQTPNVAPVFRELFRANAPEFRENRIVFGGWVCVGF